MKRTWGDTMLWGIKCSNFPWMFISCSWPWGQASLILLLRCFCKIFYLGRWPDLQVSDGWARPGEIPIQVFQLMRHFPKSLDTSIQLHSPSLLQLEESCVRPNKAWPHLAAAKKPLLFGEEGRPSLEWLYITPEIYMCVCSSYFLDHLKVYLHHKRI